MLTDNKQIFRNCFAIIYCHLTKVSSEINKCIIFQHNELSITLSSLCMVFLGAANFTPMEDVEAGTCVNGNPDKTKSPWGGFTVLDLPQQLKP